MPYGYTISHDEGLIAIHGSELVSLPSAIEIGRGILRDPDFDPELPQLFDLRGLTMMRNSEESRQFRDFSLYEYFPQVQAGVAVVVDDSLDDKSLAALYHLISQIDQVELFDNYDQALRWLMRKEFASESVNILH